MRVPAPRSGWLLVCLLSWASAASAQTGEPSGTVGHIDVRIVGRQSTSARHVQRSMRSVRGQPFDAQTFENDLQRIRNYEVFTRVDGHATQRGDEVDLEVRVEDRWTIVPAFRPSIGAGVQIYKLGIRDSNFLGRNQNLVLLGGPYLSRIETNWVAGWIWNARQFAGRHELWTFGGRDYFVDSYYDYGTGEPTSDVRVETLHADAMFWYRIDEFARVPVQPGVGVYASSRRFTLLRGQPPVDGLAPRSTFVRPRLGLKLGRVDFAHYRYRGADLVASAFRQFAVEGTPGFWGGELEARYFARPFNWLNLAFRARADVRNNVHSADDVAYGGLDRVRGFPFNWLRGKRAGVLNSEARILIHESLLDLVFLQGVVFYDVAVTGGRDQARVAQSLGLGTRLAVIPVFGMFSRLDVARSLTDGSLSFDIGLGIREFF